MFAFSALPVGSFVGVEKSRINSCAFKRKSEVNADGPQGQNNILSADDPLANSKASLDKIRERLLKVELSVSAYDTAWVAMVPSPRFPRTPYFPECVDWIIDNQHSDGSWVPTHHKLSFTTDIQHKLSFTKDALLSTLACVLALRRWNVGEEYVKKGLSFIGSNFSSMNEQQLSPVGFGIIFPGMINYALEMGLDLPLSECDIDAMFSMREVELRREVEENSVGSKAYLAFVAEGLCGIQDWQEVMSYQRKNGSLFNSPSTTAAALGHIRDEKSLNYLSSILQKFGSSVPTTYPLEIHTHLSMVDKLERLGISLHFIHDIRRILDRVYRCWVESDEEIYSNVATCAMAFRVLRMHGYDVSSDALSPFADARHFKNTVQGHIRDLNAVIELYKASQAQISSEEPVLKKLNSWVTRFLKEEVDNNAVNSLDFSQEVDYILRFPCYANLERLEHKRNIEHCNLDNMQMLKTSFVCSMNSNGLLELAVDAFSSSQLIYRKELQYLESWVKESKLDQLGFSRQKQTFCYFSTAATLFSSELSSARLCWAKGGVLSTVVDDFFDVGGSSEELANLIKLVEKYIHAFFFSVYHNEYFLANDGSIFGRWHGIHENEFCSENVKILFFALQNTVNDLAAKASLFQKRDVTNHMIKIWLAMMNSMMKEADRLKNNTVPTVDEYMTHAIPSFALGPIILTCLYFVGPKLSEDIITSSEYYNLFELVSKLGRFLNDIQGLERDKGERKLNYLSLLVLHGNGSFSEEDARRDAWSLIESTRAELLGLVLQNKGSVVPKACKEVFWKMSKVLHYVYRRNDAFSSPKDLVGAVNAVIHEPLKVSHLSLSKA